MSLFRRIWLAVIGLTLAAFIGSLLVNVLSARSYLEKQLYLKNLDNATALALSMSQIREKDPVTIELLLTAQFDTGHYQQIKLADPAGKVMVERKLDVEASDAGAPSWFVRLFPISAEPGIAHVQDGWKQFGTITLSSQGKFAYQDLWQGTLDLSLWFAVGGLIAGLIGILLLRLITRPLDHVVEQARAITRRQFITVELPKVPELRSVVTAMNDMVARVKQMFADEAARLESLRQQVNHDSVTGLPNREFFIGRLREALSGEQEPATGLLAIIRLADLNRVNSKLGHVRADALLQLVADKLNEACSIQNHWLAARVRGPDFALLAPNAGEAAALAAELLQAMRKVAAYPELEDLFHLAVVAYRRGDAMDTLLAGADGALAVAEGKGPNEWHASEHEAQPPLATSGEGWRSLLGNALTELRLKLASFPVLSANGVAIHQESAIRLQTEADGPWLPAGDFMPMAERLKLTAELDLQVIELALSGLRTGRGDIAVNLSADSIADWGFHNRLVEALGQQPELCKRLWVEVAEQGVFRQPEAFRDLCRTLKGLGCRVGIEHFGHRFGEVAKLSDLGLDYLKVDGSFIHDIHLNIGNQEFLRGVCRMAHSIGVSVIAESVRSADELAVLPKLGFDGVTGPAVTQLV
jgi:diguanylate cyclase (GGDEF)-like protein